VRGNCAQPRPSSTPSLVPGSRPSLRVKPPRARVVKSRAGSGKKPQFANVSGLFSRKLRAASLSYRWDRALRQRRRETQWAAFNARGGRSDLSQSLQGPSLKLARSGAPQARACDGEHCRHRTTAAPGPARGSSPSDTAPRRQRDCVRPGRRGEHEYALDHSHRRAVRSCGCAYLLLRTGVRPL
jgi:hypothetical protein